MATHQDRTFRDEDVVLDGNEYIRCKFIDCTIRFAGGQYTTAACNIEGRFSLVLSNHSANTLHFFQMLCGYSPEMRDYMLGLIAPSYNMLDTRKLN